MDPVFVIYGVFLIVSFINYLSILQRERAKKELIGDVRLKWSSRFHLSIPLNWAIWGFVILYLGGSIYFIASKPHQNNDWTLLVVFFLFMSFYPKWEVRVGTKGILVGTNVYLWEKIEESTIVKKGKYGYLKLKHPSSKEVKIPFPLKYRENIDNLRKG